MLRERGEAGVDDAVLARPIRDGVEIDLDQRARKFATIGEQDGLADERARFQQIFDLARRDILAAGRDHDVLLAVDDPEMAVRHQFGDIAGVKPAVADDVLGRLFVLPVASEHSGTAHEDFAVGRELHLLGIERNADVAGLLEWLALAQHQRVLGDAVKIAQIDAPDLPERLDRLRNRRARP